MSQAEMTLAEYRRVIIRVALWVVLGVLWDLVRSLCTQCAALISTNGDNLKRSMSLYNKRPWLILFEKNPDFHEILKPGFCESLRLGY